MVTLESVMDVVVKHVGRSHAKLDHDVGPDTKMFQQGLIDSFGLVELQAALEKMAGRAFPEGELAPDDFESPRVLFARLKEILG
jgi:acyl carrier protein